MLHINPTHNQMKDQRKDHHPTTKPTELQVGQALSPLQGPLIPTPNHQPPILRLHETTLVDQPWRVQRIPYNHKPNPLEKDAP